jgi:putative SOS response-associated peptidase YedK
MSWWVKSTTAMPAILKPESYGGWLGMETDPHNLLITYPSEPMTMWPISTRVNNLRTTAL